MIKFVYMKSTQNFDLRCERARKNCIPGFPGSPLGPGYPIFLIEKIKIIIFFFSDTQLLCIIAFRILIINRFVRIAKKNYFSKIKYIRLYQVVRVGQEGLNRGAILLILDQ